MPVSVLSAPDGHVSDAEASARLQRLESRHDLLRYKLDGWCVWPILRFSVAWAIQHLPLDDGEPSLSKKELLPLALADLFRLLWMKRAQIVVKTYSSAHRELEGGRRKDVFFDDLLRANGDHFKIEALSSRAFYTNPTPYLVPRDLATVAISILGGKLARWRPSPGIADISTQISQCLNEELGVTIYTPQLIASILSGFHWGKRLFRMILERIKPKCLLLADAGDYPITAAARELGINVIEFQHGVINRHCPASSWSSYALPFKASMALPNQIFLYGSYWQREMAANGFWKDELCVVGSMRVDSNRRQLSRRSDDECTMVMTTQGIDTERLIAFLADFVRLVNGRVPYRLYIKMHPTYHNSDHLFDDAFGDNGNVRLVAGSEPPSTFDLLKQAHLHLSVFSSCHYEALVLGVPTVILPLTGAESVIHLHEAGHAFYPQTPQELLELVLRWREHRVPDEVLSRIL